ncbi:hypothetical protein HYQ46_000860 [Verticillium longisporum]|nr:hypothetical protein HYQ46_000860 [Verticillium longisporum]
MAAAAPAEARSCLALTLLPAALGRLLAPVDMLPVPVLVRLIAATCTAPVAPEVRRTGPDTGLCGLTPVASRARSVGPPLMPSPGGSGSGLGADAVLWRLAGEASRAGIRGAGAVAFLPVMNS